MKRILAKLLVVLMLMTSVAIPTEKENSARAATKKPGVSISGSIDDFKKLEESGITQQVGKTMTITIDNVKKGNVKSLTCYIEDPRVATITQKKVTKKKASFKVTIKKLGKTRLKVRFTLKKKEAGSKYWWKDMYVTGVKKLTKKELAAFPEKYVRANTHSTILNKYKNLRVYSEIFDKNGNPRIIIDYFLTKDDGYVYKEYKEDNTKLYRFSTENTGLEINSQDGTLSDFYFCMPIPGECIGVPLPDDPEDIKAVVGSATPELCYYDGSRYYYTDVATSESDPWQKTENILDGKTYELESCDFYVKDEAGKMYIAQSQSYEPDYETPDVYVTMKYQYAADNQKRVKLECVVDPGTSKERHITTEIPAGAKVKFASMEGYRICMDPEGRTPLPTERDTTQDITVYYKRDPMVNPKVVDEIIPDENAIYGYVPNPESTRLGVYASYDFTDPVLVAEMREKREAYHKSVEALEEIIVSMKKEGKTTEEIARVVCPMRNEIRIASYKNDPEGLEKVKASNLATYGNENGPTTEWLINKYKTWELVLEKAMQINPGADAVLGLYDKYYETYIE